MEELANFQEIFENLDAGQNAIVEIAEDSDFSHVASLSKMHDALRLLREGVDMPAEDSMIEAGMLAVLDDMIDAAGGVDERALYRARLIAMKYVNTYTTECGRQRLREKFATSK